MAHPLNLYMTAGSLISALGFGLEEHLSAIRSYRSGIVRIDDAALFDQPFCAARIEPERLEEAVAKADLSGYTRMEQLFLLCLDETIRKSGVDPAVPDCGLILSTTKGNIDCIRKDSGSFAEAFLFEMAGKVARHLGCVNEPIVISNACISGLSALIVAARLVEAGFYKQVLVAGGDLLTRFVVTGFQSFKSVSPEICRPYDSRRDGLSLGEACGAVLVTSDRRLVKEEQPVVISGGAITNDANHISGPSRTGDGLYYAISQAMEEAGVQPSDISFVNSHGTATLYNDEMESKALHWAGLDTVPLNSLKPYLGHTLGASGIIESLICLEELRSGEVYGTYGYETTGVPFPLSVSPAHRTASMRYCVKTASGFGGCNSAVVLALEDGRREETVLASQKKKYKVSNQVVIQDGKVWVDGKVRFEAVSDASFSSFIRNAYKSLELDYRKFYKMDDLCKLGYIAAAALFAAREGETGYEPGEVGMLLSNASSSLDTDLKHQQLIDTKGDHEASPAIFVYTLPNVVMGELCIRYKIQGENTFFINRNYPEDFIRRYAEIAMEKQKQKACLVGWCEWLDGKYEARFEWLEQIH